MNIVVRTYSGNTVTRPDTTLEKQDRDLYVPESVSSLLYTPVMFARISGSSKHIAPKFVTRYYDAVGFGMLLYPGDLLACGAEGFAAACCMDHTSFLPFPLFPPSTLNPGNTFSISKGDEVLFSFSPEGPGTVEEAVCKAVEYVFLRTGDLVAAELAPLQPLALREEGDAGISGLWCGRKVMDFNIIF